MDGIDGAREEFYSEAQELIDTLSRNLLALDAAQKAGLPDPTLINEAFRAVHTLKGLAGLFGSTGTSRLAHATEDLLDELRLGRRELRAELLDPLFRSVDVFTQILLRDKQGLDEPPPTLEPLLSALRGLEQGEVAEQGALEQYALDPGVLAVLTEYEEHRLRASILAGLALYKLRVCFDLTSIDRALDELKERAKPYGEIITYLPTGESPSVDTIELDVLFASAADLSTLVGALGTDRVVVEPIARSRPREGLAPSVLPPAALAPSAPAVPQAGDAAPEVGLERSLKAVSQTVRVDIRKLDHLMNIVGELSLVRSALQRWGERLRAEGHRALVTELQRLGRTFDRRLLELQDGILEVRMVPLGQVFDRLARVLRQVSRELGKDIRLVITGAETELDKLIVEELSDPLMHMIRNAIDHGIEGAEQRRAVGKPAAGTIALNAFQKGNHVMIEIEDDGGGIDAAALVARAVRMGVLDATEASQMSHREALELVFTPGLSTKLEASDVSGRGVGMDVVKTNIARLGGVIDLESEPGIGTKLAITLPTTLAIVSALMVEVAGQIYAVPLAVVSEALAFDGQETRRLEGREVMSLRGASLTLCQLAVHLRLAVAEPAPERRFVVVSGFGARRMGLVVDRLIGQQDIVVKPLGHSLAAVRGFSGATDLGDQRVALVLDVGALIEEVFVLGDAAHDAWRLHG